MAKSSLICVSAACQVNTATIIAVYLLEDPLEKPGSTKYDRMCFSGGFLAPDLVITSLHGFRHKQIAEIIDNRENRWMLVDHKTPVKVIQVPLAAECLRAIMGVQADLKDRNHPR